MLIKDIEIFKGLSNMEQAKILGMLDKKSYPLGSTVFLQGEPGDCMYIICRGQVEILSTQPDGSKQALVQLGEGDVLGEMALLTGEPRSAEAVAVAETELYVIDQEVFQRMLLENAKVSAYFIQRLSQRLMQMNQHLAASKGAASEQVALELARMSGERARFLLWCSLFHSVTKEMAVYCIGIDPSEVLSKSPEGLEWLSDRGSEQDQVRVQDQLVQLHGPYSIQPDRRAVLRDLYIQRHGYQGVAAEEERAVQYYKEAGELYALLGFYGERGRWDLFLQVLNEQEEPNLRDILPRLDRWLELCPKDRLAAYSRLEGEVSAYYHRRDGGAGLEGLPDSSPGQGLKQLSIDLVSRSSGTFLQKNKILKSIAVFAAFCILLIFYQAEPVLGLSREAMLFVGVAVAAVILWIIDLVPDYVVSFGMLMVWVLGGIVPVETALSGFATPSWLFMIFIMGLSAAVTRSGILYRFSLNALKRFPPTYRGQLWGIIAGGILMNPLIPSSNAKVSMGVPMARTLSESIGFRERSPGAAGFGLAAMVFYGFTAPFVLTGSYTNMMAFGIAAGDRSISWVQWFMYALPGLAVFLLVMLGVLSRMVKEVPSIRKGVTYEVVEEQLKLLGPLSKAERLSLSTVLLCIVLMILEPVHGLANVWVLMLGFSFLVISGVLDRPALTQGIDWTFLLFLGVAFSFAGITEELGISRVISEQLVAHMGWAVSSSLVFLIAVVVFSFVVTLVIRDDPAVILLVTAFIPLGSQMGIHPWVLVFVILLSTDPFFFKYQSPTYLSAYSSSEGKCFNHTQGQQVALGYGLAVMAVVVASVPYWKWLGLVP